MVATFAVVWMDAETKVLLTICGTEFVQKLLAKPLETSVVSMKLFSKSEFFTSWPVSPCSVIFSFCGNS